MPLVELSFVWLLVVNIVAWGFFHIAVSYAMLKVPDHFFQKNIRLLRIRNWEREGEVWQTLTRVKKWKHIVPDGAKMFEGGFEKRELQDRSIGYFDNFITESKRAEVTHWLSIVPAALFFLWNPLWAAWLMVVYALVINVPIIILQRFNRGRLSRVVRMKKRKRTKEET
ncbi:glycosyl-4,4'-diaponeurosporenoate acyltransferase [Geomicrobium sp. JSM 1781026]|uniref:glycosyl-4,4'-diaponeurosporenoate acyltransferase CrtO family protein n=1 Tax=Geomicrobium sp. JSM 1781026 TaxID=3344580 RepID=UPI0035BFC07E